MSSPSRRPKHDLTDSTGSPSLDLLREIARTDGAPATRDLSGSEVGRYRLRRQLGAGGMGVVYEAEDGALSRLVALKVLRADRTHATRRERFMREARLASSINHANVATVYDVGESSDAGIFIAMELCEGESLRALVDPTKGAVATLGAARVCEIGAQIARGLHAAHVRGVVHRDLKPDNVMVLPDGTVKVLDFGVAKSVADASPVEGGAPATTTDGVTVEGAVVGTPWYMSPEQADGLAVDARSDLYSLGVLLCELATGERPSSPRKGQAPRVPGAARDLPRPLRDVILRCLEVEPSARFRTAAEVGDALSAPALGAAGSSRRRWLVSAPVVVALAALGVVAVRRAPAASGSSPPTFASSAASSEGRPAEPSGSAAGSAPPSAATAIASARPEGGDPRRARPDERASIGLPPRPAASATPATTASATASSASASPHRPPRDPLAEQK